MPSPPLPIRFLFLFQIQIQIFFTPGMSESASESRGFPPKVQVRLVPALTADELDMEKDLDLDLEEDLD